MADTLHIYVDGSGRKPKGGFGWFVKETGKSHYEERDGITNNQAEYMAVISALHYVQSIVHETSDVVILSDSLNTVKQLNHEYAINNAVLREFARKAWSEIEKIRGGGEKEGQDTTANYNDIANDSPKGNSRPSVNLQISWVRRSDNIAGKMLGS